MVICSMYWVCGCPLGECHVLCMAWLILVTMSTEEHETPRVHPG